RSEQLTRQLIDSTHDVVALCNPDGVLLLVNDALVERLGRPRRDLLGTVVFDHFPPDAAIKRREYFRRACETGCSVSFRDDFTQNVFETTITPIREEDGTISRLGIFVRDITDRCKAEQSLIRAERMTAIGTLAAGIAHQFNNLNQIVLGNLAMTLKDDSLSPAVRDQVERAHRAVKRSRGLTHNLLAFSRPREAARVVVRLDELVDDALKICRRSLEQDDITVRLECQPVPPSELDPTQVEHVLLNLVMNARDAMLGLPVRQLTIRVEPVDDRRARITVSDTGHGIDPDNLGKIFDPFFTTRYGPTLLPESGDDNLYGGSGLGLSIAMQIVQQHHGSLDVESTPGKGTTFTLTLPLQEPTRAAPPPVPPRRDAEPAMVLVVDDEPEIRQLLAGILPKSTFSIIEADNARSAIEQVSRTTIDLVITDLQMPGQNGLHLVRVIMDMPASRQPALVVMTGKLSVPEEKLLGQLDHCRLLLKPFEPDDLLQACYEVLQD
ncbi:MAG: hybrid sensor histidine kinase/response regulator, partial [Planctomycetota bacterium]